MLVAPQGPISGPLEEPSAFRTGRRTVLLPGSGNFIRPSTASRRMRRNQSPFVLPDQPTSRALRADRSAARVPASARRTGAVASLVWDAQLSPMVCLSTCGAIGHCDLPARRRSG
jgi:hypothetical protein